MRKFLYSLLTLFFICEVHAFTLISAGIKGYADPEIPFSINQASCPSNVDLRDLVQNAIIVWNGVTTSKLNLTIGPNSTATNYTYPPVAYCDNTMTGTTLGQGGSGADSTGHLAAGLLRINTNPASTSAIFYQSTDLAHTVLAHEIGHVIGLGHSEKSYALMYASASSNITNLALSQDDIDGVSFLYPRDEQAGDKAFGCGLIKNQNIPPQSNSMGSKIILLLLLLCPVLVLVGLRRKVPA